MATRAKALRQFAKKYFNLDLVGMSETAVLKDLLKKEYNIDAVGNSVVSVLMNAAGGDGGGGKVTLTKVESPYVLVTEDVMTPGKYNIGALPYYLLSSITLDEETLTVDGQQYSDFYYAVGKGDFKWRITIDGKTSEWSDKDNTVAEVPIESGEYSSGQKVDVSVEVNYKGETGTLVIKDAEVMVD